MLAGSGRETEKAPSSPLAVFDPLLHTRQPEPPLPLPLAPEVVDLHDPVAREEAGGEALGDLLAALGQQDQESGLGPFEVRGRSASAPLGRGFGRLFKPAPGNRCGRVSRLVDKDRGALLRVSSITRDLRVPWKSRAVESRA